MTKIYELTSFRSSDSIDLDVIPLVFTAHHTRSIKPFYGYIYWLLNMKSDKENQYVKIKQKKGCKSNYRFASLINCR